nr:MAG TPA: hypothetical protein [Caudoviricetes sp.]
MWRNSEARKSVGQEKKSLGDGRDKKCREWRRNSEAMIAKGTA